MESGAISMTRSPNFRNSMSLNHLQPHWGSSVSVDFEQISPEMPLMIFQGWGNVCNLIGSAGQTLHIRRLFVFIHSIPLLHVDNQLSHALCFKDSLQCFQTLPPVIQLSSILLISLTKDFYSLLTWCSFISWCSVSSTYLFLPFNIHLTPLLFPLLRKSECLQCVFSSFSQISNCPVPSDSILMPLCIAS